MDRSSGPPRRRGYGQYCAIASALDVVGERWTLLIIRDLFLGPKRYTDLREGLPGIATDLLTARLRTLEGAGLVGRRTLPKPAPAAVYELTERGRLLGPALAALARVGFEFLGEPGDDAQVPAERLVLALRPAFDSAAVPDHRATYQLELDGEPFIVAVRGDRVDTARGTAADADLTIRTSTLTLIRLLRRSANADTALAGGALQLEGDAEGLARFLMAFPIAPDAAPHTLPRSRAPARWAG